jgi:hypothetical protein
MKGEGETALAASMKLYPCVSSAGSFLPVRAVTVVGQKRVAVSRRKEERKKEGRKKNRKTNRGMRIRHPVERRLETPRH